MSRQKSQRPKTQPLLPLLVMFGGVVLLIAALAIGLGGRSALNPTPTLKPSTEDQVQRLSVQDAKEAYDSGRAVFLDVRSAESFASGHIPGALNIPLGEIEARMNELNPDDWIITY